MQIDIQSRRGITILEFCIALLIAGLVIGTITPVYLRIVEKKRIDYAIGEITEFQRDIDRFSRKYNRYPDDLAELYTSVPIDPWGTPYSYSSRGNSQGAANSRTDNSLAPINTYYDLYSSGPDKISLSPISANESRDDIIRARNGNFIGIAADFR
jgi:general secretion pathway protein G